jgi:tryptophanyl-tRNA synthetase
MAAEPSKELQASVAALSVTEATATDPATSKATEQEITPWDVSAGTDEQGNELSFDYEKISQRWATSLINETLLERFERLTGKKPHRWLRRGLFFSHRDFDLILDCYERGDPFFLYTGRGPSAGSLHIGHTIPFEFTKWLQDVFDVPLVIMLTDDEKALFKNNLSFEETMQFARENARDVIAMGFDVKKTFIYSDLKYLSGHILLNAWEFSKLIPFNQVRGAFGFDGSTNIGRIFFPALQCVAAFATSYPHIWGTDPDSDFRSKDVAAIPCLIPCAIDQDPYFRLVRDNCHRMANPSPKPALIHSKFLTALQGPGGKMSASNPNSAIFMSDSAAQVKKKINKFAFSGGQDTAELQREHGGNPDVDVAYQYLSYFEDDDAKLQQIHDTYKKGELLTGELKATCIKQLQDYVVGFQERRSAVTDEVLKSYMTPRTLQWGGNPNPNLELKAKHAAAMAAETKKSKKSKGGKKA